MLPILSALNHLMLNFRSLSSLDINNKLLSDHMNSSSRAQGQVTKQLSAFFELLWVHTLPPNQVYLGYSKLGRSPSLLSSQLSWTISMHCLPILGSARFVGWVDISLSYFMCIFLALKQCCHGSVWNWFKPEPNHKSNRSGPNQYTLVPGVRF